eukprot:1665225-Pleurochrysis_carterae.AAC.1
MALKVHAVGGFWQRRWGFESTCGWRFLAIKVVTLLYQSTCGWRFLPMKFVILVMILNNPGRSSMHSAYMPHTWWVRQSAPATSASSQECKQTRPSRMRRLLLVLLLRLVVHVQAPCGLPTLYARSNVFRPDSSAAYSSLSSRASMGAIVAATALAAAAALRNVESCEDCSNPDHIRGGLTSNAPASSVSANGYARKGRGRSLNADDAQLCSSAKLYAARRAAQKQAAAEENEDEADAWDVPDADDSDDNDGGLGVENDEACADSSNADGAGSRQRRLRPKGMGKLWTANQFPEGIKDNC